MERSVDKLAVTCVRDSLIRFRSQCPEFNMSERIGPLLQLQLRFYQLLGLHTLPLPDQSKDQNQKKAILLRSWAGCLLLGYCSLAAVCFSSEDDFLYGGDRFGYFNDALKYGFALLAVVASYVESLGRRPQLARFWQLYAALQPPGDSQSQSSQLGWQRQWQQHTRYLVALGLTTLGELLLMIIFWHLQFSSHHLIYFWLTFEPFIAIVHLRNMQVVLHLELLRQQLSQLERELALLADYAGFARTAASFGGFEEYLRRRLRRKQLQYGRICELHRCFRQAFSCSVLAVLLMVYVRVLVDCYFMYYNINLDVGVRDYCLLPPAMLQIPACIYAAQNCQQLVTRIAYQLHRIIGCSKYSPALSLQIQNFSLQILHQPVRIDCFGGPALDGYLLTRIVCSVTTYMIFFIQFMPKFRSQYF